MVTANSVAFAALSIVGVEAQDRRESACTGQQIASPTRQASRKGTLPVTGTPSIRDSMLAAVPRLRAFAMSLCRNVDRADDLVQETLLRALAHIDSFQAGTNLPAWLCTILRNTFRSEYRKRWREVEDIDGSYAETLKAQPEQTNDLDFQDFLMALDKLPVNQREALVLVGASGYSYGEAAKICDCAVGTIKSRVRRARIRLAQFLSIERPRNLGIRRKQWAQERSKGGRNETAFQFGEGPDRKNRKGYQPATRLMRDCDRGQPA
jgi:RNA polymerase sigma-70 factor, ECF subfamily